MYTRSTVPTNLHPAADTILKQLKKYTKRIQALLETHQNELALLDRLHYKGRNQHRSALFWQRVNELRHYARRVGNCGIAELHVNLRDSFYGNETQTLRGSWTHLPPRELVTSALPRFSDYQLLVDKANERYHGIHRFFMLQMQNGAFLQLILTLVAINSRFAILMQEISAIISSIKTLGANLASIMDKIDTTKQINDSAVSIKEVISKEAQVEKPIAREDTGPVLFDQYQTSSLASNKDTASPSTVSVEKPDIPPPMKRKKAGAEKSSSQKKKKRDAIDEIFGL